MRVTATALELQEKLFFQYIAERSDVVCCVEHPKDSGCQRTHCHIYVSGCKVKYDAIGNKLSSIGIAKGNEGRSIKDKGIDEGYITYMSKGQFNPSFVQGLTTERYEQLKACWVNKESSPAKGEKAKRVEKTDFQIYEEIVAELEKPYPCFCYACTPMAQYATIHDTTKARLIPWDPDNAHEHVKHAMRTIRAVRYKHKKVTNQRKMEEILYMLINHRDINPASISRMEKFLFN